MRRNQYTLLLSEPARWLVMAMVVFACAFSSKIVWAQGATTAALNGTVKDNKGEVVYGANVIAKHEPSGTIFGAYTRADGRYNIPGLRVGGPYTVTVSFIGYKETKEENVNLGLGEDRRIDFKIQEEAVAMEGAVVEAERNPIISSSRTGATQTVTTKEIQQLPTINRSFADFTRVTPQIATTQSGGSSIAGRNNRYNMIQIDGAVDNDLFGLSATGTPGGQTGSTPISMDAIQEFQVLVAPYDIRQGNFTGGGVNAITRSGTNKFEFSGYNLYRNESYVGQSFDGVPYGKFLDNTKGFRLGGPIMRDKLFFFVSAEQETDNFPTSKGIIGDGSSVDYGNGVTTAIASRFDSILTNEYSYNPGGSGFSTLKQPSTKLFGRLDYTIDNKNHLTFRANYVDASSDVLARNTSAQTIGSTNGFRFANAGYSIANKTTSVVGQLNSAIGKNMYNEATIGYSYIDDHRSSPGTLFPNVFVKVGNGGMLVAGIDYPSDRNLLQQKVLEVTDNFTYYYGAHTLTFGTHNEFFSFKNGFFQYLDGAYLFSSLDSLIAGHASAYNKLYGLNNGALPFAEFNVNQFGFYVQDIFAAMPNLNFTLGLRVDVPEIPDKPTANHTFDSLYQAFGFNVATEKLGQGHLEFSPRVGVNWDVFKDKRTQVRGGIGLFSGRTPYVWISNNFSNTGADFGNITQSGAAIPFVPIVANQPTNQSGSPKFTINVMDPNFKNPQIIPGNIAIDQELGWGVFGSVEFIGSKNVNDVLYRDISLSGQTIVATVPATVSDGRPWMAALNGSNLPVKGNAPNRYAGNLYNAVYELTNTNIGYQLSLTTRLQKTFGQGLFASIAYTYGRSNDANSLTSSVAASSFQFNPIQGDPNHPGSAVSNWEIRNKITAEISKSFEIMPKWTSTISFIYIGRSGRPYSVTYNGDVNGDGNSSNDLIYIPKDKNDVILVAASGSDTRTPDQMWVDLDDYISGDPYLNSHRGQIAVRNGSREPWVNRLDMKLLQDIPITNNKGQFQLTMDIFNLLNAFNKDWGLSRSIANEDDSPITFQSFKAGTNIPQFSYLARTTLVNKRFNTDNFDSRWAFMLGIRYNF